MEDQMPNIIELIDENNQVISFEHIMTLDYDGREYIVLAPTDRDLDTEEDEVVILRVEQDENGDDCYVSIDDEDELEEVFAAVNEVYEKGLQ
ncbi:MAG TPA: DUF1292 domain-containing protein [Clostridiales bacterium]|nr:DUF1292 domain-containing protein [Clostridiales bacterium]